MSRGVNQKEAFMKNNFKVILMFSLIFPLLFLTGCSQYDNNGGFPSLFGPMRYADPGYVSGNFSSNILIWAKEEGNGYSTEISSACINIDPTSTNLVDYTSEPNYTYNTNDNGGYVNFYFISAGRHMLKATHPDYEDITEIINVPGDGMQHEYTIIMRSKASSNPDQPIDPDMHEVNNTFYTATNIDAAMVWAWGEVEINTQSYNFNLNANFHDTADEDWYKMSVTYQNNYFYNYIYVTLKNIPSSSNYDVEIYDNNQYKLSGSYTAGNAEEQTYYYGYNINYNGYLYIRVFRINGDPTSSEYRLHIEGIR
jgi:hypothetical protein